MVSFKTANSEGDAKIDVKISGDELEAYLLFRAPARISPPTSKEVSSLLIEKHIPVDRDSTARITEALSECRKGNISRNGILLMRGKAPGESRDEELIWETQAESGSEATPLPIRRVKAGAQVARLLPSIMGPDGVNVFGQPIPARQPRPLPLAMGPGVQLREDRTVAATADGAALVNHGVLQVVPLLELQAADLKAEQSLETPGLILVHGQPPDGIFMNSGAGVFVAGKLGAALVSTGGPLVATEGIEGKKETTQLDVQGDVWCPFVFEAQFNIHGDLWVESELHNVDAHIIGSLRAGEAVFSGGEITSSNGAEVGVLGSPRRDATKLSVGVHHGLRKDFDRLNRILSKTSVVYRLVEHACATSNTPSADAATREKVCQWELAKSELSRVQDSIRQKMIDLGSSMKDYVEAVIKVKETMYAECRVGIGMLNGEIPNQWIGPLEIAIRVVHSNKVLIIESHSGRKMVIR